MARAPSSSPALPLVRSARAPALLLFFAAAAFAGGARAEDAAQTIYRYVGPNGRTVFVNGLDRVPAARRRRAKAVDLSHVSLNEELGADMRRAIDEQLSELLASDYCSGLRHLASRGFLATVWRDHGHLVLIGAVLLLFLLASPWLVRTVGAPQWAKLVIMLVPTLAVLALLSTAAVKASEGMRELRAAADPCQPEHYADDAVNPAAQARRLHDLFDLRRQIEAATTKRTEQIDSAMR